MVGKKAEPCKMCITKCEDYEKTIDDILNGVEDIVNTTIGYTNIFNNLKLLIQKYRTK